MEKMKTVLCIIIVAIMTDSMYASGPNELKQDTGEEAIIKKPLPGHNNVGPDLSGYTPGGLYFTLDYNRISNARIAHALFGPQAYNGNEEQS